MLKPHLLQSFEYARWANRRIIDALAGMDAPPEALRLLSHLLRAQQIWLGRIRGEEELPPVWGEESLEACHEREEAGSADWLAFLEGLPEAGLQEVVVYHNSRGRRFENTVAEIAAHVVNHCTHHRAQVATLIREAGGTPPATDLVFWARELRAA